MLQRRMTSSFFLVFALWMLAGSKAAHAQSPAGSQAPSAETASSRPNIVYILCDDLGYGDVKCLNPKAKVATPNLDSIATGGMIFTDAHSNSAVCTPTRYGVMTGRYAFRTRLKKGVLGGYDEPLIDADRLTVAKLLSQQGYATACIGKWHLGLGWKTEAGKKANAKTVDFSAPLSSGPHTLGFAYSYIIPASLDMDPYVYIENGKVPQTPTKTIPASQRPEFWRGGPIADGFTHESVLLTLTQNATAYIAERGGPSAGKPQPFFLYLPLTSPHTPHVPRAEFRGKSGAGNYGDFVQETDWSVGQILAALDKANLSQNTLVILTSDNGAHVEPIVKEINGHSPSGDFRGQKSDDWEGGHHVPFLVRWPARIAGGSRCDQTICLTDLMATAADLTGVKLPDNAAEDSVSLLPLLSGKTDSPVREAIIHHSIDGSFAIRQGDWKLIVAPGSGGWSLPEKQATNQKLPPLQLYNMKSDPAETNNVQSANPEKVAALTALLEKYRTEGRSVPKRQ